jgi:hypothetical protein
MNYKKDFKSNLTNHSNPNEIELFKAPVMQPFETIDGVYIACSPSGTTPASKRRRSNTTIILDKKIK